MLETILSVCLMYGFTVLLIYVYFRDKEEKAYIRKLQSDLTTMPLAMQKFYVEYSRKEQERTQKMIADTFTKYLAHIEKLERLALPTPITEKDVKTVIQRVGTLADETLENEIELEKDKGVQLQSNEWTGLIGADTKVAFENEDAPTIVE